MADAFFKTLDGGAAKFTLLSGTGPSPYHSGTHNPYTRLPPIISCRHGKSASNHDPAIRSKIPHPAVSLVKEGREQAKELAEFLIRYGDKEKGGKRKWKNILVVMTTMPRTVETAQPYLKLLREHGKNMHVLVEVTDALREIDVGLYPNGVLPPAGAVNAAISAERYQRHLEHDMGHYSRYYHGESKVEVADRVLQWLDHKLLLGGPMFSTLDGIVLFGHGITSNILRMCVTGSSWESHNAMKHPNNASARLFLRGKDKGYIFRPTLRS